MLVFEFCLVLVGFGLLVLLTLQISDLGDTSEHEILFGKCFDEEVLDGGVHVALVVWSYDFLCEFSQ